jgi:predicted DCC family thiol-disulfide oxidoreductase YuxK
MKFFAFENGWTGGQFSFFRIIFGTYLIVHFCDLIPWSSEIFSSQGMLADGSLSPLIHIFPNIFLLNDSPLFVQLVIMTGLLCSVMFTLGYQTKAMVIWIAFVLACLFGRNPLIANPALPYVGFMLLCIAFIPKAPYGSLAAKGLSDMGRQWVMPKDVFLAAWIILAATYSYSGYTKILSPSWLAGDNINFVLNNPLARDYFFRDFLLSLPPIFLKLLTWAVLVIELFFAPLALFTKLRPILWGLMALIQLGFALCLNFLDLTAAMIIFHLFTFNPAWIKPKSGFGKMTLYYDGECGFCHRVIRFLLAEDKKDIISFSPLQGQHIKTKFSQSERDAFPDSIVLVTENRTVFLKSSAVCTMLISMGGFWRIIGHLLSFIPQAIRDITYTGIGKIRKSLVKKPDGLCPLVDKELRAKFLE